MQAEARTTTSQLKLDGQLDHPNSIELQLDSTFFVCLFEQIVDLLIAKDVVVVDSEPVIQLHLDRAKPDLLFFSQAKRFSQTLLAHFLQDRFETRDRLVTVFQVDLKLLDPTHPTLETL